MKPKVALSLTICFLECTFMGGALFAWGPILYSFEQDNIYNELCDHTNKTTNDGNFKYEEDCSKQASTFNLAFTLGIAVLGISSFPVGAFFDRFGLFKTRIILSLISALGLLCWGFASPEAPWLVFLGSVFSGMAAMTIITTNCHAAELAGSLSNSVITLFNASLNSTAFWMTLVLILQEEGFHRKWSFLILTSVWILGTVNTVFLLPRFKVGQTLPNTEAKVEMKKNALMKIDDFNMNVKDTNHVSLKECFLSPIYLSHMFWFSLLHLRISTFLGTMIPWMVDIYPDDDDRVGHFTRIFGFLSIIVIVIGPISGLMTDYFRKKFEVPDEGTFWSKARAIQFTLLATSSIFTFMSMINIFRSDWSIYLTLVMFFFDVSSFYGPLIAFIAIVFPIPHFGKLVGFMYLIASIVQFLQIPLLMWAENGNFTQMLIVALVISVVSYYHPILIMIKSRKRNVEKLQK